MNIRNRILLQTLSASLAFTLFLSAAFFLSVAGIRNSVLRHSEELGDNAALISAYALEEQVTDKIIQIARDMAVVLDENIEKIENHTKTTADIAGIIYTRSGAYRPRPLPLVAPGAVSPAGPYLYIASGTDGGRIRSETDLAGNIETVLRQITVVDRGITTSTIAGESGYVIAMDVFPWPQTEFDPREMSWYRGAREREDLFWTAVYADIRGRGPAVSCAMPFYDRRDGGRIFKGVARSTVMLSDFSKIIDSTKIGRTGYLFLLDQKGLKLFSSGSVDVRAGRDGTIQGENYLEAPDPLIRSLALSMTLGASGMVELELDGAPAYAAYAPVHTLGWSLAVAVPVQEVSAPAQLIGSQIRFLTEDAKNSMDRRIIFLAALVALFLAVGLLSTGFLAVRFTGAITSPILALNEGVREVSGGSLNREVKVDTGDELEELAASFNIMTGRLKEQMAKTARTAAERQRINTELDVAARIQINMLPREFPPFPGKENVFALQALIHPAREVGGDFYDFFFIDDTSLALIAADVSGKGIPAALFMAITKTMIKDHLQAGERPETAMEKINRRLCDNNGAGMFVTLWLGVLDIPSGRLEYINAGHNPPLIKSGGHFELLRSPPDLVLAGMDDTLYHCRETTLKQGDTLFLYTDGVTEAENEEGIFYGTERLKVFLDSRNKLAPQELLTALFADIQTFSAGTEQADDITMLVLRMEAAKKTEQAETFSITLKADAEQLGRLVEFISEKLENTQCPEKIRGHIELAAEEIFINIASYAYIHDEQNGADSFDEVRVVFEIARGPEMTTAALCFTDRGTAFNPLDQPDPDTGAPLEEREAGGLGILIIKRFMDTADYRYDDGTNNLVITKSWQTNEPTRRKS